MVAATAAPGPEQPQQAGTIVYIAHSMNQHVLLLARSCAGIFLKQSMGARNRVGIGLSYRLAGIDSFDLWPFYKV